MDEKFNRMPVSVIHLDKDSSVSSTASVENVTSVHTAYQPEVPVQEGSVNG